MHSPRVRLGGPYSTKQNLCASWENRGARQDPLTALTHTSSWQGICEEIQEHINAVQRLLARLHTWALSPLRLWGWLHPWLLNTMPVRKSKLTFSKKNQKPLLCQTTGVSRSKSKHMSWFQAASCHFQAHGTFPDVLTNIAKNDNHNDSIPVTSIFCIHIFIVSAGSNTLKNWFLNAPKWYRASFLILLGEEEVQQGACFIYTVAWPDI